MPKEFKQESCWLWVFGWIHWFLTCCWCFLTSKIPLSFALWITNSSSERIWCCWWVKVSHKTRVKWKWHCHLMHLWIIEKLIFVYTQEYLLSKDSFLPWTFRLSLNVPDSQGEHFPWCWIWGWKLNAIWWQLYKRKLGAIMTHIPMYWCESYYQIKPISISKIHHHMMTIYCDNLLHWVLLNCINL